MNSTAEQILQSLRQVAHERATRAADELLARQVVAVKALQHARFERSYRDMLLDVRYRDATLFFLEDLYGPADFSARDQQFARVVPALVRLFPDAIVRTVSELGLLHALSERLDTAMARSLVGEALTLDSYAQAWRRVGEPEAREEQIRLMLSVGEALDRYTRSALLRNSLRLMRKPASAAGLGALQGFLERGFDTFRAMRGADRFLGLIAQRERSLSAGLFAGAAGSDVL